MKIDAGPICTATVGFKRRDAAMEAEALDGMPLGSHRIKAALRLRRLPSCPRPRGSTSILDRALAQVTVYDELKQITVGNTDGMDEAAGYVPKLARR